MFTKALTHFARVFCQFSFVGLLQLLTEHSPRQRRMVLHLSLFHFFQKLFFLFFLHFLLLFSIFLKNFSFRKCVICFNISTLKQRTFHCFFFVFVFYTFCSFFLPHFLITFSFEKVFLLFENLVCFLFTFFLTSFFLLPYLFTLHCLTFVLHFFGAAKTKAADGKQDSWQCQESSEERRALFRAHKCPESVLHI